MQKGRIYRKGSAWLFSWNVKEGRDGAAKWVRHTRKLAPVSDRYRTPAQVRHLAEEILSPINAQRVRTEPTQTVTQFIELVYMPFVQASLRPATVNVYEHLFKLVKPHLGDAELREFDVPAADRVLRAIGERQFSHTTNRNCRNFLSGVFRYALRLGTIRHGNPVRDAVVPKGKPKGPCPAYTIEQVQAMLHVLPEPARTAVLVAALTGLRHSEIRGLRWDDFDGKQLFVRRSVWRTHIGETKTLNSAAPVPVLPVLADALKAHKSRSVGEYIFSGSTGKPLTLANTVRRDMMPALKKAGIAWLGWHAFRRGVATNLYDLGVKPKVIQEILRHSDVNTTLGLYIKTVSTASTKAMRKLEKAFAD
jgi:integrase